LDHITRVDASSDFNGTANVPKIAITMGVSTILLSKRIVLLAWGQNKADIIKRTIQEDISAEVPATAESCKYHFCFRPISSIRIDPI
jgi:glucosamine-6-phosphate deaminase